MSLPHCATLFEHDDGSALRELAESAGEVVYALSKDFFEPDDAERFEEVYAAFAEHFAALASSLEAELGPPVFRGRYDDPGYPEWAYGDVIAAWHSDSGRLFLRLEHPDRELPIAVSLRRADN